MPTCLSCGEHAPTGAEVCAACDAPLTPPVRRLVVLVFADLAGWTAVCERLDPEEVHSSVGPLMWRLRRLCEGLDAAVEGIQGDGFLAIWGARQAREDDHIRALVAAGRMQRAVHEWRGAHPEIGIDGLHVGVHVGEVLVSPTRSATGVAVTGDAVNVTQRVSSLAAAGETLVTQDLATTAPEMTFEEPRSLELRNRSQPVTVLRLPWADASSPGPRPVTGVALVDRVEPRRTLGELLDGPTAGTRLVAVVGEAGVGKSRLVREVLAERAALLVLEAGVPAFGSASWTDTLGLALRSLVGEGAPGLAAALAQAGLSLPAGVARRLARLVGAPLDTDEPDADEDLGRAFVQWLSTVAARTRVVLVIGDLHHAPERLLRLLSEDLSPVRGLSVLLTARPEARLPDGVRPLVLGELPEADAALMLRLLIPGLADEASRTMAGALGGNPLFAEEWAAAVQESGNDVTATAIPLTLRSQITARLDLLPHAARQVVRACAIAGSAFDAELIDHLVDDDSVGDAVAATLADLVERGVLVGQGAQRWSFRHALVREVTYAELSLATRHRLHLRAAQWCARLADPAAPFADPAAPFAEAEHRHAAWTCRPAAEGAEEAAQSQLTVAELMLARDPRSGREHHRRATAVLASVAVPGAAAADRLALVGARVALALGEDADALASASAVAGRTADAVTRCEAELLAGEVLVAAHDPAAAALLGRAATSAPSPRLAARALELLAFTADEGLVPVTTAHKQVWQAALDAGDSGLQAGAARALARHLSVVGGEEAARWRETAAAMLRPDDLVARGWVTLCEGYAAGYALRWDDAAAHAAAAAEQAGETGAFQLLASAEALALEALSTDGGLGLAAAALARFRDLTADRSGPRGRFYAALAELRIATRAGDTGRAAMARESAVALAEAVPAADRPVLPATLATVDWWRGDAPAALAEADQAVREMRALGHLAPMLGPLLVGLRCAVDRPEVAERAAELAAAAERDGADRVLATARRWLAQGALLRGELTGGKPAGTVGSPTDAEQDALDHELVALRTADPAVAAAALTAAVDAWQRCGEIAWGHRSRVWLHLIGGDEADLSTHTDGLARLGAPAGLARVWAAQWQAARGGG